MQRQPHTRHIGKGGAKCLCCRYPGCKVINRRVLRRRSRIKTHLLMGVKRARLGN